MISGILLAGGKSLRMHENKSFLRFKGRYLFEHSLNLLKHFADEIFISTSDPLFEITGYKLIADEFPGSGPIGGIYSCLNLTNNQHSIVLPCDLPLLDFRIPELLLKSYNNFDITVIINNNGLPEPLVGIYSKSVIPTIFDQIKAGKFKIHDLLQKVNTNYLTLPDCKEKSFLLQNINTQKDFKELIQNYE